MDTEKQLREVDKIDALAFLEYQRVKYVSFKKEGNKIVFLYEPTLEFDQLITAFLNKTIRVDPSDYNYCVRSVLRLIKEILKGVIRND